MPSSRLECVYGFIGKRQCFKTGAGSYRELVEGKQQWGVVGQPGEVETKTAADFRAS